MENIDCFIRITFMHFDTSTIIWHKNFMYEFAKLLQLLGDFVPPDPLVIAPLCKILNTPLHPTLLRVKITL